MQHTSPVLWKCHMGKGVRRARGLESAGTWTHTLSLPPKGHVTLGKSLQNGENLPTPQEF